MQAHKSFILSVTPKEGLFKVQPCGVCFKLTPNKMKQLNDCQKNQVKRILADKLGFDVEEINDDSSLKNDLGVDSLDELELVMEFEKEFNCRILDSEVESISIVSDYYKCIATNL